MANVKYVLGLCAGLAISAVSAHAQTPTPSTEKFFLNVNVGGELATRTINAVARKTIYDETATLSSSQPIGRGAVVDFDGGYRVREDFFAGLLVSFFGKSSDRDDHRVGSRIRSFSIGPRRSLVPRLA